MKNEEVPDYLGGLGDMLPIGTLNNNNGGCSHAFGVISLKHGILPEPFTYH